MDRMMVGSSVLYEPGDDLATETLVEPSTQLQPEKQLMVAVLEGAVRDFQTYATSSTGRGRRIFVEADEWFRSPTTGPFTFETICHALGLDPDYIRSGLRAWHREQRRQPAVVHHLLRSRATG
jgi:hypothetical protein